MSSRGKDFPGAHPINLFFAGPLIAQGKLIVAGGSLEQVVAASPFYKGSTGRGFIVALDSKTGHVLWKYDLGPKPEPLSPPITIKDGFGDHVFYYGPATSSIWSTPSFDAETGTIFFGTDVNTAPRRPTPDDPRSYTRESCAIVALDVAKGTEKWVTQLNPGDIWTNSMRVVRPQRGAIQRPVDRRHTQDLHDHSGRQAHESGRRRLQERRLLRPAGLLTAASWPARRFTPVRPPIRSRRRPTGGCSPCRAASAACRPAARPTAARSLPTASTRFCWVRKRRPPRAACHRPAAGLSRSAWTRRPSSGVMSGPRSPSIGGPPPKPTYTNVGDPVASGIAVANGVIYFTTVASGKLVALDAATGAMLNEIDLGPVWSGPSVSRGRVYVGTGNTLFSPMDYEAFFPKKYTGELYSFGLPGDDEVSRMGAGTE